MTCLFPGSAAALPGTPERAREPPRLTSRGGAAAKQKQGSSLTHHQGLLRLQGREDLLAICKHRLSISQAKRQIALPNRREGDVDVAY
jgi:hypothetical protein